MAKRKSRRPQKQQPDLDIVIPVYGRPDLLHKCLESLERARQDIEVQLILVDDNGPDREKLDEFYRSLSGQAVIIRQSKNGGFPGAVNVGAAAGRAPLILILNTDIELEPEALAAMKTEFDDPKVGVVGPKLLFPLDSQDPTRPAGKVQHTGLGVNFQGQIIHANIGWSADHPRVNERRICQAVTGACLMTRRSIYQQITTMYHQAGDPSKGAFSEVYGKGTYEDVEFCFAVRSLDYQVIYTPAAVAYHHVGASVALDGGGYPIQRNEMIFRARCGQLLIWDEWKFL